MVHLSCPLELDMLDDGIKDWCHCFFLVVWIVRQWRSTINRWRIDNWEFQLIVVAPSSMKSSSTSSTTSSGRADGLSILFTTTIGIKFCSSAFSTRNESVAWFLHKHPRQGLHHQPFSWSAQPHHQSPRVLVYPWCWYEYRYKLRQYFCKDGDTTLFLNIIWVHGTLIQVRTLIQCLGLF